MSSTDAPESIYMVIRGGIKVDLLNPRPSDFKAEPIARALSYINRFAGNYGAYSVAQHAVLCSMVAKVRGHDSLTQLACLHHDDTEAITNDIPSPVKEAVPEFRELEARLMCALEEKYVIDLEDEAVHEADETVFANEVLRLIPAEHRRLYIPFVAPKVLLPYSLLMPWGPEKAFARYMDKHESLERDVQDWWSDATKESENKA